jgi:hypothetical protein
MTAAIVLVILVAPGQERAPATTALVAASTEVIGGDGAVRLVAATPTDDVALRIERELGARAAVQLTWLEGERARARLRLHAAHTDRWIEREIAFSAADTPAERGRTLGFAAASMLPEGDPMLRFSPPDEPPAPSAPSEPPGPHAVGLFFFGGKGLGGPADGLGGALTLEKLVGDAWSVGASLAGRLGHIDPLSARLVTTSAGFGAAWWPVMASGDDHFGLALRAEALALYHLVSHTPAGGGTTWKGYLVPGAGLRVEGTWRLARHVELLVGGGSEVAFGTIDVEVVAAGTSSAQIPALRATAEAGFRARF